MEKIERETIEKFGSDNSELRRLYEEHQRLETKLQRYESRRFLTPGEQIFVKSLKKKKLAGVDRMMAILADTTQVDHARAH
jgi:uncharacterized protein